MKKYLLNISKEELDDLNFILSGSRKIFFNVLSKGRLDRDSIKEKFVMLNSGFCYSSMVFGNTGENIDEERKKEVFMKLVEMNNIELLNRFDFVNKQYDGVKVKLYQKKGNYGFDSLVILETDSHNRHSSVLKVLSSYIVSEISHVELFEEYNLYSNKTNETFEVEDQDRMYDLCATIGIPMNEIIRKYWINVINIIDCSDLNQKGNTIDQDSFYRELERVLPKGQVPDIAREKHFKQFLVFQKWFNTTNELLNISREKYLHKKAIQLNEIRKMPELNEFI